MDFLAPLATPEAGLAGLFAVSFLAATLLPGGSEAALLALLLTRPELAWPALLVATVGNTAGGMTTWAMGRALRSKVSPGGTARGVSQSTALRRAPGRGCAKPSPKQTSPPVARSSGHRSSLSKHIATLRRWGPPALLLAWAPVIGDALCAAAGWLRLPALPCTLWMATGKAARYAVVVAGAGAL
jgi:membrane protein YqaA with SNARE-associated domain